MISQPPGECITNKYLLGLRCVTKKNVLLEPAYTSKWLPNIRFNNPFRINLLTNPTYVMILTCSLLGWTSMLISVYDIKVDSKRLTYLMCLSFYRHLSMVEDFVGRFAIHASVWVFVLSKQSVSDNIHNRDKSTTRVSK